MTTSPEKTVVYDWVGPPHIRLYRIPVTQGGRTWQQHIYGGNESGIGVVAVTTFKGKFLFVSQYRPAVGETLIEFPRGFGDPPEDGFTLEQQAIIDGERETLEETGIATKTSAFLGYIWPDSGIIGSKIAVVAIEAESDEPVAETDSEVESALWLDQFDFTEHLCSGRITDGVTLSAYSLWSAMMRKTAGFRRENESLSSYLNR
jgi:ADP-ribose pyrophosphatase